MAINWSEVITAADFAQIPNQNSGGWFWTGMLFMLYAILLISMLTFGFEAAVLAASFACLMIGIIMVYLGVVAWTWVAMFGGIIVLMFLWIMYSKKG